jgi:zinc protease
MSRIHFLLVFSLFIASGLTAQKADKLLPVDPNIKIGKLSNGLTYYIRKNQEPKNRAELRLVVNAGLYSRNR